MIAILGGLGAAVMWATSTLCSSRSTRILGPATALAWVSVVGLVVTAPVALAGPWPVLEPRVLVAMLASGVTNVLGLLFAYAALRIGKVGVVAPVLSTEGAIAAGIAIVGGEQVAPAAVVVLASICVGIVLASRSPDPAGPLIDGGPSSIAQDQTRAVMLAIAGAAMFGINLYATGWLGTSVPLAWAVIAPRVIGTVAFALPLAIRGRLRLTSRAAILVAVAGLAEVGGSVALAAGAGQSIATASVLSAQFAGIAALVAYLLFRERLARLQVAGVVTIAVGVAALTLLRA
jgi:drug/metabolite transporter (DMT)-like permease